MKSPSGRFEFCDSCGSLIVLGQCSNKKCPDRVASAVLRAGATLGIAMEAIKDVEPNSAKAKQLIDAVALDLQISRKQAIEVLAAQFTNSEEWAAKAGIKLTTEET